MKKQLSTVRAKSLKWSMLSVIISCWILPVILLVTVSGWYITKQTQEQAIQAITQSAKRAVAITQASIQETINLSLKASYMPQLKKAWQNYETDKNDINLYNDVIIFLSQQYKYNNNVLNTMVIDINQPEVIYHVTNISANGSYIGVKKFNEYLKEQTLENSKSLGTDIGVIQMDGHYFLYRNLVNTDYKVYAVLVMELNKKEIFEPMNNIIWAENIDIALNNETVNILTLDSTEEKNQFKGEDIMPDTDSGLNIKGASYLYSGREENDFLKFEYTVRGTNATLQSQLKSIIMVWCGVLILIFPLTGSVILFFYKKVNAPVVTLMKASQRIKKGEFGITVEENTMKSREFEYLKNSFNDMSMTLKNQFERLYKEEIALRDARIMALQSQIDPHFLNNTLETINWQARAEGNIKVCDMIEALSTMLSAAMDRDNRRVIHLSEELMYVDAYLYITRERMGHRMNICKEDIDVDVLDCYVPRLVLQPIIENAVVHGITPAQEGNVMIRAYRQGDWLKLEVENDGVTTYKDIQRIKALLEDQPKGDSTGKSSLGIRNINQRLKMLYGEKGGLSINLTEKGTLLSCISVKIHQDEQ